jgi:hypothetical protein
VIKVTKKHIRVILIGVLCMGIVLSLFSKINQLYPKSIKDKIVKKCSDNTEIIINMSDFTDFEWEKCIVYGPATQTKDICDMFNINYNTYLDLNYGIIFTNNNNVVYEEFFKVSDYNFKNKIPEFIIYPYSQDGNTQIKYASFKMNEAKFKCIKKDSDNDYYYRLYPID